MIDSSWYLRLKDSPCQSCTELTETWYDDLIKGSLAQKLPIYERHLSKVKSSRVESSRVDSSRVESSRVESSRVESSRIVSSRVVSSRVGQVE